jgi:hypothetical protein
VREAGLAGGACVCACAWGRGGGRGKQEGRDRPRREAAGPAPSQRSPARRGCFSVSLGHRAPAAAPR